MDTTLVELFRHNLWANLRLLDVCAGLDDAQLDASAPGTYGRIRDTLVHLLSAEEGYVALLSGNPPTEPLREDAAFPGFQELCEHARRSGEALIDLAPRIDPTTVLQGTRQGKPYAVKAAVPLMQAINHATEHRVHIVSILSPLGVKWPALDAWAYGQEREIVDPGAGQ